MPITLDDLFDTLAAAEEAPREAAKATSLRLPPSIHKAATIAASLGMDDSLTDATAAALLDRTRAFARRRAIAEHLARYPEDRPTLGEVALRRVSGTDHVAARRPELTSHVATWYERRHPDWAISGAVDAAVDAVLEHVELVVELDDGPAPAATG